MKKWLDKYEAPKAQNGIEGTMGGLTDIGFNYNGAWGGTMQDGGYIDSVLNANKNLDWVQRLYEKNTPSIKIPGQKGRSTHFMESADGRVYPTVVRMPNGKLKYLADKAYDYADSTKTYIQFPSDEAAQQFGKNYKKGTGVLKDFAMGGSIPGAVGFTYARTAGAAPANGPYAKKTKASAQNGRAVSDNTRVKPIVTETASKNKERGNWLNKLVAENVYPYGGFSNTESEYKIDNFIQRDLNQQLNDKKINFKQYKEKLAQNAYNKEGKKLSETWNRKRSMPIPDPSNLNASYDALYIHQGLPQKYNSFVKSQYKPSTSKNPNSSYYSLSPSLEKEILEDLTNYENKDFIKSSEQKRQVKGSLVAQAALKNFQYSKGKDEKGNYIAYYDVNDYNNPLDWIGNPFEIYGRIYLDPKTGKPKMQNGGEMKFYQEGLDFKPKTISQDGIVIDPMGYWNPDNVGEPVIIPSNVITMEGVDQPLIGISDTGDTQMMYPGEDYDFDGEYVTEYPVMQQGGTVPLYVSDANDPRLKTYQDSLYSYNIGQKMAGILQNDKNLVKVSPKSVIYKNLQAALKKHGNKLLDNSSINAKGYKNYERVGDIMKEYQSKGNKGILPINIQPYWPDPDNSVKDLVTLRSVWDAVGITDPRPPSGANLPEWKKPEQQVVLDPSKASKKPQPNPKLTQKKPIQKVEYKKPEPKKEEPIKKTEQPKPVERKQNVYEGSPVYSGTVGSGGPSALVGFVNQKGDTTFIKPEDYERFGVPAYGKEYIESKAVKKKESGGKLSVAQKGIKVPPPTAADSLRIYNMQLAQNAYYNKFKDAFEKPEIHSYSDDVYNNPALSSMFIGNNPAQSLQTFRENITKGQEYPDIYLRSVKKWHNVNNKQALQMIGNSLRGTKSYNTDPNIIYYKDLVTPIIDPAAPFSIFDKRIKPQGTIFRKPKPNADFPGENVETFYYDPIAVKPYAMRTPEEQKEFNRKYGKPEPRKTPVKPQPKKEEVKKPEPSVTRKPEPLVERRQNVYEGTPVYSPGTGSGAGSALIGFMGPKGDTTYIKPEDYERFAVPKYGKEFIESKKKKMKNGGGVSVNNADAQPIEKLDQLLNFTNYNKPTKGGWLDKYN